MTREYICPTCKYYEEMFVRDNCEHCEHNEYYQPIEQQPCTHPDKCHECEKILTCTYYKQEPCDDVVSRQAVDEIKELMTDINGDAVYAVRMSDIRQLPPVKPQEPTGHCKDCKYFEYDSVAKVDGIPLIVAHEICSKWGDGCKTKEDGYCFLFKPQERSE